MEVNSNSKALSLGFLGVGWIGKNRMEVLLENSDAIALAIAEPFEQNATEALEVAKGAIWVQSAEEIFTNNNIDGVVIATPSALHASQSLSALQSGKAVFCQKPLARTAAEVLEVVEASRQADRFILVDFSYRYTKAFQAVLQIINRGVIGKIFSVDLTFHNAYGPDKEWFYDITQSGGGCVMDLGIHMLDMAMCCLDFPEVVEINSYLYSDGKRLKPEENKVEDFAKVSMITEKETAISMECSWNVSAGKDAVIRAVFYGTNGAVAFENIDGSFYDFKAEKYNGTSTETLVSEPDDWSGKAGVDWVKKIISGIGYDEKSANEYLAVAKLLDRIYGR